MEKYANHELFSPGAEQYVLSACLREVDGYPAAMEVGLKSSDFFVLKHRRIFSAIDAVSESGMADVITVAEYLGKDGDDELGYLTELATSASGFLSNLPAYVKLIRDYSKRRKWVRILSEAREVLLTGKDTVTGEGVEDVFLEVDRLLIGLDDGQAEASLAHIDSELKLLLSDLDDRLHKRVKPGLMTGYSAIDYRLGGATGLWIIAGRPGMGKTQYFLNIAREHSNAQKNLPEEERAACLSFNLEMSNQELVRRLVAQQGHIVQGLIKSGKVLSDDDQVSKLNAAFGRLKGTPFYLCDQASMNVAQIVAICQSFSRKKKIGLVAIDYLQLIENISSSHSRADQVGDITRRLKILSKVLGCPVMLLSQLNRDVEKRPNKIPRISDLRDSGSIEQDADIIQFPYRDEYYNDESPHKGQLMVATAKLRDGEVGEDFLSFNAATGAMVGNMDRDAERGSDYEFGGASGGH